MEMKVGTLVAAAAALTTLGGALTFGGQALDQWFTTDHELAQHALADADLRREIESTKERLAQVDLSATQQALESAELRASQMQLMIEQQRQAGQPVPESLESTVNKLKRRIQQLEARSVCLEQNPKNPERCP